MGVAQSTPEENSPSNRNRSKCAMASGSKTPAEKVTVPNSEVYYWVEFPDNISDLYNKAAGFTKETKEEDKKIKKVTYADYVKVEKDVKDFLPYTEAKVEGTEEQKAKITKENEEKKNKFKGLFGADSAGGVDAATFKLNWAKAFGDEVDPARIKAEKKKKEEEEAAEKAKKAKAAGGAGGASAGAGATAGGAGGAGATAGGAGAGAGAAASGSSSAASTEASKAGATAGKKD